MIIDPEAEARAKAAAEEEAKWNDYLDTVDVEGNPFYLDNPDAEGDKKYYKANSHNAVVSIVEDDLNPGNYAYKIEAKKGQDFWSYFHMPTKFKPGVTYKVELDIRILNDSEGQPITVPQSLNWNFRYTDVDANGATKEKMDHHNSMGKFTTDMGWKHVSFTHKISEASPLRNTDTLSFYSNPFTRADGVRVNVSYMIDNVVVTVVE
jgi:hypothetical protein